MKQNQYQQGAAGSFIIIAVVLTLVALTVLYGARQFMSQQSAPITAQDITPRSDQQTAQAPHAAKPDVAPQGSGSTSQQSTPQSSQSSGAADRQAVTTPQQAAPRTEQPASSSPAPSQHLPQTGPASAAVSAAGLATLTTLALLYIRSRRLV